MIISNGDNEIDLWKNHKSIIPIKRNEGAHSLNVVLNLIRLGPNIWSLVELVINLT